MQDSLPPPPTKSNLRPVKQTNRKTRVPERINPPPGVDAVSIIRMTSEQFTEWLFTTYQTRSVCFLKPEDGAWIKPIRRLIVNREYAQCSRNRRKDMLQEQNDEIDRLEAELAEAQAQAEKYRALYADMLSRERSLLQQNHKLSQEIDEAKLIMAQFSADLQHVGDSATNALAKLNPRDYEHTIVVNDHHRPPVTFDSLMCLNEDIGSIDSNVVMFVGTTTTSPEQ